jgi:hypothetical protein
MEDIMLQPAPTQKEPIDMTIAELEESIKNGKIAVFDISQDQARLSAEFDRLEKIRTEILRKINDFMIAKNQKEKADVPSLS